MTALYVLDVPENAGVVAVAEGDPSVAISRIGPYFAMLADGPIVIDRRASGCRHAVWYSCIAAIAGGTVTQWDKDALRVDVAAADDSHLSATDRDEPAFREAGLPA